jgi:hypothetical protein
LGDGEFIPVVKLFQLTFNIGQATGSGDNLVEDVGFDITDILNILPPFMEFLQKLN